MPCPFLVILTTLPTSASARKLTGLVLKKRLAACINLLPSESFFWWKGRIDRAKEQLLFIKTRASHFEKLRRLIERHHPYSVPEIIAFPIQKGNASYLKWLEDSLR